MNKYKVVHNDETIHEYPTLFDAYKAVDYDAVFLSLKDYIDLKFASINTCDEFKEFVELLDTFSNLVSSQVQARYNVQDISKVFVLTTGSNDLSNSRNLIVLENEAFISQFNSALEKLGYTDVIEKNDELIKENIKKYLLNHVIEFLAITNYFVNDNYTINCNPWSSIKIANDELNVTYSEKYNEDDPYNAIINGELCSATEYDVLNEFMNDIDHIVDLIIENSQSLLQDYSINQFREFAQLIS